MKNDPENKTESTETPLTQDQMENVTGGCESADSKKNNCPDMPIEKDRIGQHMWIRIPADP